MNYAEIRDIARDVVESETRYRDNEISDLRTEIRRLEETVYQLANYLQLSIRRNEGTRIEPLFPEVAQVNGPSFVSPFPPATGFGQSIGGR